MLKQVKKGKNKEHYRLPQINLAFLFGEESCPFYSPKLPRHVTDVKPVRQLMQEFNIMGYKKVNVVQDHGFYSKRNVVHLYQNHQKFIIGVKLNLSYVKANLEEEQERLKLWSNLHTQYATYDICKRIDWPTNKSGLTRATYCKKHMQDAVLLESWTMQGGLLDELDTIEQFEAPGYGRSLGEVTQKQADLYRTLGVKSASL